MAQLAVDNGYRTSNNGTAWSYFSFVADYFSFDEYYSTSSFNTAMSYLERDDNNDGNSDYYVIASCGSGLFTSGGHYIALVGKNGDTIQVYDPYLYSEKFNTASRRNAGAVVSGNSVFVSETSFVNYANYRNFWIFSNDSGNGNTNTSNTSNVNYTRYVATQSSLLNVRDNPNGNLIGSLQKGVSVNVIEVNGEWSRINSPVNGWVSSNYLSGNSSNIGGNTTTQSTSYTARITASSLRIRSGVGTEYSIIGAYSRNTNVTILTTLNGWGKTSKGWIYLGYTTKTSNYSTSVASTDYVLGRYKVMASALNVRAGAGINYNVKKIYKNGTIFDTYEIKNGWARTPSGWISLSYCSLMYKY